jgi:nucleoside-diphosphate-sugar epimerase
MIVSVLGCGWLGFPLAQRLVKSNYTVKGSTTTEKKLRLLQQNGIEPFLIQLPESLNNPATEPFWDNDILFLNIPPGRNSQDKLNVYPEIVKKVVDKCKKNKGGWVIFASSTSVYSETGGITFEEDAKKGAASRPSGEAILEAEDTIKQSGLDYTILRFGGLYGYGRHPIHYLSGKKNLPDPLKPVNLIHQTDCLNIVMEIIRQKKRNEIYNVVADGHPPRNAFYTSAAAYFSLPKPQFLESSNKDYRIACNKKIKEHLMYCFCYPNPMDFTP